MVHGPAVLAQEPIRHTNSQSHSRIAESEILRTGSSNVCLGNPPDDTDVNVRITGLGYTLTFIVIFLKELKRRGSYDELWKAVYQWEAINEDQKWPEDYLDSLQKS